MHSSSLITWDAAQLLCKQAEFAACLHTCTAPGTASHLAAPSACPEALVTATCPAQPPTHAELQSMHGAPAHRNDSASLSGSCWAEGDSGVASKPLRPMPWMQLLLHARDDTPGSNNTLSAKFR